MLALLLTNSIAYSQKTMLNEKGDTLVCFTQNQSKYLLKQCLEVNKLTELNENCKSQSALKDSLIDSHNRTFKIYDAKISNLNKIINYKDTITINLVNYLKIERDKTFRQRNMKYIWMGVSAIAFGLYINTIIKN